MDKDILGKAKALCRKNNVIFFDLGIIGYNEAFKLQQDLFSLVRDKGCSGFLLMLEHPPVITIGSNRSIKNLVSDNRILADSNIELVQSTRGGDITFHGPGQLVGYPILNLDFFGKDLSLYVHNLEQLIINTLKHFDIQGRRVEGRRGIFVGSHKIASVGIKIKRWITMHGFSLNVSTDLAYFNHIIACGLKQYPPTSMEKILNKTISLNHVKEQLITEFEKIFTEITRT
ncbi:MAG: lipoyl(octanoyl) transferase LipB [Actinomycetota bacterium]